MSGQKVRPRSDDSSSQDASIIGTVPNLKRFTIRCNFLNLFWVFCNIYFFPYFMTFSVSFKRMKEIKEFYFI